MSRRNGSSRADPPGGEEAVGTMEGQGVARRAYSHVTDDRADAGEDQRRGGDDTLVMPAVGGEPGEPAAAAGPAEPMPSAAAAGAAAGAGAGPSAGPAEPAPPQPAQPGQAGHPAAPQQSPQPHTRVDARLLEAALLNLRKRIAAIPLVFEIAGAAAAKAERAKLLSQIDDYLLPRVRRSAAPLLVALVGSTGAGKSTLLNSIVGTRVSATGVRRPMTNSPVLACHPDDIEWFAENNFLP